MSREKSGDFPKNRPELSAIESVDCSVVARSHGICKTDANEMRHNCRRFEDMHDLEPGRRRPYYDQSIPLFPRLTPPHVPTRKVPMTRPAPDMTASAEKRPNAPRLAGEDNYKRRGTGAPGTAVITKTKPQTKRPSLYRVLLLNDDYTPMEF